MKRVVLLMLATLLTISCSRTAEPDQPAPLVSGLKIETLQMSAVDDYYEAVGTVQAKNRSVIAAQVMGNIVALRVREGDIVRAGQTLIEIDNRDAGIHVVLEALGKTELNGNVEEIVPAADPATRSYIVKITLPNTGDVNLRSGLYGKARFVTGQRKVLSVPQTAVTQQGQLVGVYVADQSGFARLRLVKTGRTVGDRIEVLSGLNEGEEIVSEAVTSLRDGIRVREATKDAPRIAGK